MKKKFEMGGTSYTADSDAPMIGGTMASSMAKGGKLIGKQKNLDLNKNGKLDSEDFKMIRGKMATGGGVESGKKYKLRAEGLDDFLAFLQTGMYMKIKSFTVEPIGIPDVVVTFETNSSLSEIKSKLKEVPDSHVMLQTVKPIGEYTGERMEWGGTAESSESGQSIGGENQSSMYQEGGELNEMFPETDKMSYAKGGSTNTWEYSIGGL